MAVITWDDVGDRKFEVGADRGVFYPNTEEGVGVPWNGLISVDIKQEGVTTSPVYFDDRKVNEVIYLGDISAILKAYTYPDEFLPYDGFAETAPGMFIDGQSRGTFNLCYRNLIGDDVNGIDAGYKLHLLYNLTAIPEDITNQTIESNITPIDLGWTLTSVPEEIPGFRPASHIMIDSTKIDPDVLSLIEDILYGTDEDSPRMPSMYEVYSQLAFVITDNEDGTWSARGPDDIVIFTSDNPTFDIDSDRVTDLDSSHYEVF